MAAIGVLAKRARTHEPGTLSCNGEKYNKKLLEEAEAFAMDGQISFVEAKKLLESAKDGQGVTNNMEKATLRYAMKTWPCSPKAKNLLDVMLKDPCDSRFQQIDGKQYVSKLIGAAEVFAADGQISHPEVNKLIKLAKAGDTKFEVDTLKYAFVKFKFTDKAKQEMEDFLFVKINGVQYDKELFEKAKAIQKDGQIFYADAQALFKSVKDGSGFKECEKRTLEHTLRTMQYSGKAKHWMTTAVKTLGGSVASVNPQQHDTKLLEKARSFASDGQISFAEARALFEDAQNGPGLSECAKRTLEYTLSSMKYTDKAKQWMTVTLENLWEEPDPFVAQIDGVQYDKTLLEKAQTFVGDGQISHAEAQALFKDATDEPGILGLEKRTLERTLQTMKYTDKAKHWMQAALADL